MNNSAIKYILRVMDKITISSGNEGDTNRARSGSLMLVLSAATIGLFLLFTSSPSTHTSASQHTATTTSPNIKAILTTSLGPLNKAITLAYSKQAALTAYPNASKNALSSSAVDEQTGNAFYKHGMGNGQQANSNATPDCQPLTIHYAGAPELAPVPCVYPATGPKDDFMTGTDTGLIYGFPGDLTINNKTVSTALTAVQAIALACIVPLIILIGLNVMKGAVTTRFANGVEALSRLLPVVIAIVNITLLVNLVFGVFNEATKELLTALGGINDVNTVIPAANSWALTLIGFLTLSLLIIIAQSVAPAFATALGTGFTFGTIIAVVLEVGLAAVVLALLPNLVRTILAMALAVQFLMRIVLINFYIILSPLAIVASALPGQDGPRFTREWIMGFMGLVGAQFVQIAVLALGLILQKATDKFPMPVPDLVTFGIMALMLRAPGLFKSNASDLVTQVGPSVAGGVASHFTAFL